MGWEREESFPPGEMFNQIDGLYFYFIFNIFIINFKDEGRERES